MATAPGLPPRARRGEGDRPRRRLRERAARDPRRGSGAALAREIASILFSLSFAGHETTNNLIGNAIRRLLEEPERWDAVVADPTLIPGVVDEVLRYDRSVVVWRRQANRDVTVAGVAIPAGAKLFLWLAATGSRPVGLPRAGALRSAAGERQADPRVRQGHPLLHRCGPREARSGGRARVARRAISPPPLVPSGDPLPSQHRVPRAARALRRGGDDVVRDVRADVVGSLGRPRRWSRHGRPSARDGSTRGRIGGSEDGR